MRKGSLGLSNSEMADFRRCRRKWYLGYYRGLRKIREEEPGSAVWVGNLVHDALAHYYDPATGHGDPVAYATSVIEDAVVEFPAEETRIRKEADLPLAMIEGYVEWLAESGADADLKILGSERMVRVPMQAYENPARDVYLLSKLDVPVEIVSTGFRSMLEHKTVQNFSTPAEGFRINSQFLTEHLVRFLASLREGMTSEDANRDCSGVLVNMLRKVKRGARSKPPYYERAEVHHNITELRSHWIHVVAIAKEIRLLEGRLDAGEDHHKVAPPNPMPQDCSWSCPFFNVCPMADDGSDFEGVLAANYEARDPLERYEGAEEL